MIEEIVPVKERVPQFAEARDQFPPQPLSRFHVRPWLVRQIRERAGLFRPIGQAGTKFRDTQLGFGPITGQVGQTQTVSVTSSSLFRPEKLICIDDAQPQGSGTIISQIFIGQKAQMPSGVGGIPSQCFAPNSLGSGIVFDTCPATYSITMNVTFVKDCTWNGVMFGKCLP